MKVLAPLFLLVSVGLRAAPTAAPLTLEEAKRRALAQNFELQAARREVEEKEAAQGRSRASYWPRLGIAGGAEIERDGGSRTIGLGYAYGTFNLFRGLADRYQADRADLELDRAKARLEKAEFRVGIEVERPFHEYLFIQRTIALREEALALNETHKTLAHRRRSVSLVSQTDVMEYELREALLRSDLASLEQDKVSARLQLQRAMGSEEPLAEEPQGALTHWHLKPSLEELLKKAEGQSEPVLLAKKDLALAEVEARRWGSRWWPEVDLEARAGYLPFDDRPAAGGTSLRGLLLAKWEIFSGFETLNQRREGEAKRLRAEAELKGALLSTRAALSQRYRKLKSIEARVHLEEKNRTRAKSYYESVMREYKTGVRNSADVRQAAEGLYEASLRREKFKFDFVFERVELEKALGGPVLVEIQPELVDHPELDHEALQDKEKGSK